MKILFVFDLTNMNFVIMSDAKLGLFHINPSKNDLLLLHPLLHPPSLHIHSKSL